MPPRYLEELTIDELRERAARLGALMDPCVLCPHECGARRLHGETGERRSGAAPVVSSVGPHFGEEPPLVGCYGSGTIFLANCNLACVFCQNYDLSQFGEGVEASPARLADAMRNLQLAGCRNVNVVTPTHFAPAIVAALADAVESGFDLPLVYNCGGYESLRVLELLDGVIDIYMPDMKYADSETAKRYAGAAFEGGGVERGGRDRERPWIDARFGGVGVHLITSPCPVGSGRTSRSREAANSSAARRCASLPGKP
jgi:putative pyruvate formate lyase activating enzyme